MGVFRSGRRGFLVLAVAACLGAWVSLAGVGHSAPPVLKVESLQIITAKGPVNFSVEIADTFDSREYGLMFRKSLAPNKGMLFDLPKSQPVAFWMTNTLIPLDILFIAPDGRILTIARNAVPLSEVPIFSGGVTLGVLEIAGGRAEQLGIFPGDLVKHRIFKHG